jgi:hypothetical protein
LVTLRRTNAPPTKVNSDRISLKREKTQIGLNMGLMTANKLAVTEPPVKVRSPWKDPRKRPYRHK